MEFHWMSEWINTQKTESTFQGKLTQYNAIYCGLYPVKVSKNIETMQVECVIVGSRRNEKQRIMKWNHPYRWGWVKWNMKTSIDHLYQFESVAISQCILKSTIKSRKGGGLGNEWKSKVVKEVMRIVSTRICKCCTLKQFNHLDWTADSFLFVRLVYLFVSHNSFKYK